MTSELSQEVLRANKIMALRKAVHPEMESVLGIDTLKADLSAAAFELNEALIQLQKSNKRIEQLEVQVTIQRDRAWRAEEKLEALTDGVMGGEEAWDRMMIYNPLAVAIAKTAIAHWEQEFGLGNV
jgi:hypothetical protein